MNSNLIYDVGMHNGDDTAYYLRCGFNVIAIEANPEMVVTATNRFRREIEAGHLRILNGGVAAEDGELPFWVCLTDARRSSFTRPNFSAREIRIPCRTFRSILADFGVPFYMKVDIQGNESLCIEALTPPDIPKFISVEFSLLNLSTIALLHGRGFHQFKCISQSHLLPLEWPPVAETHRIERAERFNQNRKTLARVLRKLGGHYWIRREFKRTRTHRNGWIFPAGSSGPFGDDLPGRWFSYLEFCLMMRQFLQLRKDDPQALLWALRGHGTNPFWVDLHARSLSREFRTLQQGEFRHLPAGSTVSATVVEEIGALEGA